MTNTELAFRVLFGCIYMNIHKNFIQRQDTLLFGFNLLKKKVERTHQSSASLHLSLKLHRIPVKILVTLPFLRDPKANASIKYHSKNLRYISENHIFLVSYEVFFYCSLVNNSLKKKGKEQTAIGSVRKPVPR